MNLGGGGCSELRVNHHTPAWATEGDSVSKIIIIIIIISQAWWRTPVVPATREAEAENCLNLGGRGCSELRSYH